MAQHFRVIDQPLAGFSEIDFAGIYAAVQPMLNGAPNHYLPVASVPQLHALQQQHPYFNEEISLFTVKGGQALESRWPIHIDWGRKSALNIPVINCTESATTTFYELPTHAANTLQAAPEWGISLVHGPLKSVESFCMTAPTLISTATPHSVHNHSADDRVIFSWGSLCTLQELIRALQLPSTDAKI